MIKKYCKNILALKCHPQFNFQNGVQPMSPSVYKQKKKGHQI